MSEAVSPATIAALETLLSRVGGGAVRSVVPIKIGGNNRTYQVDTVSDRYLAKEYFSHPGDLRDRLRAEFGFSQFAHRIVGDVVPRPWVSDEASRIAIYDYVDGRHFQPSEIGSAEIEQAVSFFHALNSPTGRHAAETLPLASEAVFSLERHFLVIRRRIELLAAVNVEDEVDRSAAKFIEELRQQWHSFEEHAEKQARNWGLDTQEELAACDRCVSPSDFGFHNALRRADGRLCFLDFEYAGWDDPARMISDFFCQPAIPVPRRYLDHFAQECLRGMPGRELLMRRASVLHVAYIFKWCCIALAVFLPVSMARRKFANPSLDQIESKRNQLEKAKNIFQMIEAMPNGLH